MDKAQENFGMLLGETARLWRTKLDQHLRPLGLSQAKWLVLLHLSLAKQDLTQKELSERLNIEGPSLVRLLDRMEQEGWVLRQASSLDRRAKTIHQTEKAADMTREIKRIAKGVREQLLAGIDQRDLEVASSILQQIKQRVESL